MTSAKPLSEIIDPSWARALAPVEPTVHEIGERLRQEVASGVGYLPAGTDVLRAFTYPMDDVRVLIVGQDPYPTPWRQQGVMLLNRVLTVRPGAPASHKGWGWEKVTQRAIEALVERGGPLVAILWGRPAQSLTPMLGQTPIIASPHPSPLSASRGFFGSRPFSRANAILTEMGAAPVDWRLP